VQYYKSTYDQLIRASRSLLWLAIMFVLGSLISCVLIIFASAS